MPHADLAAEVKPEGLPKAARSRAENCGPRRAPSRPSITVTASFLRTANRVLSSRATDRQRNTEPLPLRTSERPSNRDHLQRRARKLQCRRTKYSTLDQCLRERSRLAANICKRSLPPRGLSSRLLAVNEAQRQAPLRHSRKMYPDPPDHPSPSCRGATRQASKRPPSGSQMAMQAKGGYWRPRHRKPPTSRL
jgi:hypothetical protein